MERIAAIVYKINGKFSLIPLTSKFIIELKNEKQIINITRQTEVSVNELYGYYVDDFKILVGKNGVGKTTMIKDIFKNTSKDSDYSFIYYNKSSFIFDESLREFNISVPKDYYVSFFAANCPHKSNSIYYSNTLEPILEDKYDGNISTTYMLKNRSFQEMLKTDMKNQIIFLFSKSYKDSISDYDYNFELLESSIDFENKEISISLSQKGNAISHNRGFFGKEIYLFNQLDLESLFQINDFNAKYPDIQNNNYSGNICNVLTIHFLTLLIDPSILKEGRALKNIPIEDLHKHLSTQLNLNNDLFFKYIQILEVCKMFENNLKLFDFIRNNSNRSLAIHESIDLLVKVFQSDSPLIEDLISVLTLDWINLSYGEYTFLTLFGRLHSKISKSDSDYSILLLDEVDLALHPSWQLKWIDQFTKSLEVIKRENQSFHIIISSHSPLILTDIPISSTVFLDDYKRVSKKIDIQETFGSNIQEILYNSFFLEDTIGDFSKNYIKKLNKDLNNLIPKDESTSDRNEDEIYEKIDSIIKQIELIGDPLYKKILMNKISEILTRQKEINDSSFFQLETI